MKRRDQWLGVWRRKTSKEGSRPSPLMLRILAVNVMALAILVGSILYLGRYQDKLVASELDALLLHARLSASAVAEGAVVMDKEESNILSPLLARLMIRRLVEASSTRTRLFDLDESLIADSRILLERSGKIHVQKMPEKRSRAMSLADLALGFFDLIDWAVERRNFPIYKDDHSEDNETTALVDKALSGESATQVWRLPHGGLMIAVAVPVQRYKQVLGSVVLSRPDTKIDAAIRSVRVNILEIFAMTLFITLLLSIYLARAIATPLRQLSRAAEAVHHGQMRIVGLAGTASLLNKDAIPDLTARGDEIGDLSKSLRDMTLALAQRVSAIENFAADVAHEIKNPLTSLRSAVETAERIKNPEKQARLMSVIRDDVDRLDRLISDISNASRLDAELGRDQAEPIDLVSMLKTLVDFYGFDDEEDDEATPRVTLAPFAEERMIVMGIEVRLVQVLQNLIANALSFSPQNGQVTLSARRMETNVHLIVEDEGGGIPENKLEAIFDRFYTERPKTEKFGTHSGLGLSISKQIVEAHRGRIWAENIKDDQGAIKGARFTVELMAL